MKLPARALLLSALLFASASLSKLTFAQTQTGKPKADASVSGKVTIKGKPVSGIVIGMRLNQPQQTSPTFKTRTNEDGIYRINNVPSGNYEVAPVATALVIADANTLSGQTVVITEGDNAEGIDFDLVRGGVITGKITDADGQPLIEEPVALMAADKLRAQPYAEFTGRTDDRGIYRVFGIRPGKYRVSVGNPAWGDYPGRRKLAQTYYPDVTDAAKATIIHVDEGSEATNIDIKLGPPVQLFSVTGRIIDGDTEKPVPNVWVSLSRIEVVDANSTHRFSVGTDLPSNSRGEFRVTGVSPGKYELSAYGNEGSNISSAPVPFEILDADVTGVVVKTLRSAQISGVLVYEGNRSEDVTALLGRASIYIYIRDSANPGISSGASINAQPDGTFTAGGLATGTAYISVQRWGGVGGKGLTVLRVERDGVVQPNGIKIQDKEQISGVRVVVTSSNGTIRGVIKVLNGTLPSGARLSVQLSRTGEANVGSAGTQADARGHFLIEGLAAGEYELMVVAYLPNWRGRPPIVRQRVTVTDGAVTEAEVTLDLTPITNP